MKSLITYFIKYPVSGNVILVLLLIFGFFGLKHMNATFFPETPSRSITIQTVYPGASPQEIEEGIVLKIEDNLKGVTGVERVTSVSNENNAVIKVEVLRGFETDLVLQDVKNAVDQINSFPANMEPPIIFKDEKTDVAIIFSLSGKTNLKTLKSFARNMERDFLAVEGISKIQLRGFPDEEITINVNETSLRTYNLTFDQIMTSVRNANLDITGGSVKGNIEQLLIRARSKKYDTHGFENIVIKSTEDGKIVRVKDVATVIEQWVDIPNIGYLNGKPSVSVGVYSTNDEDLLFITDYVKKYINDFNQNNKVVNATIVRDSSTTLQQRIDLLVNNGIMGFFLVMLFLAMFLHARLAFWVASSIPIAFGGMFILAAFFGITINVISLFGMILVIGILVDDGIVISENIYQHFEKGKPRIQAAIDGTIEVLPAVLSAIITTIIAFSTFFFIEGRLGDFFWEMAFIVIATLIFSLFEGAFILPAHVAHSKALERTNKPGKFLVTMEKLMSKMRDGIYSPFLKFAMYHKAMTIAIFITLLAITIGGMQGGFIKSTFFPFIERDYIDVTLKMPSGTRSHITDNWLKLIEEAAWEVNEAYKQKRKDGKGILMDIQRNLGPVNEHDGYMVINLLDTETRNASVLEIAEAIRQKAGPIPEAELVSFSSSSPFGKPVSVSILGDNLPVMQRAVDDLVKELKEMSSIKDIFDTDQEGLKEIDIKLKDKAYLLGLTVRDVMSQVRQGYFGGEIQRLQKGLDEVKVWVRYDDRDRASVGNLETMRIRTKDGKQYPLQDIADFSIQRGVIAINHLDGQREIRVEADIANSKVSVNDILDDIKTNILPPIMAKYPGVRASFEGQNREQEKSKNSMQRVMPIILLLMFATIVLTFRSFLQTIMVFLLIPFGFIGIGLGHYIHDLPISFFSVLGIIALIGIMVNDALVFVSTLNAYLKEGKEFMAAVYETGVSRFRPILLTSITTIGGLAPLILNKSFQAQFLVPMAISVAYGLLISTIAVLIILPVLLIFSNEVRRFIQWYWNDEKVSPESVEPAVKEIQYEAEA